MKKIVRLTESDLVKLVKRVIKEQQYNAQMSGDGSNIKHFPTCVQAYNIKPTKDTSGVWSITIESSKYFMDSKVLRADGTTGTYSCDWEGGKPVIKFPPTKTQINDPKNKQIPTELKDVNGVKAFQDWLDINKNDSTLGAGKGWATGFKDGKLLRAKGYGNFGPRTQKAWPQYKQEYLEQKK